MEKSGGDSSYLNNFVDNVLGNTQSGGKNGKKSRKTKKGGFADLGVVELSPFLVSLVNLGARVAVDPKLNKSKKTSGGDGEVALDTPLIGGKARKGRKGRKTSSPTRRSKSPVRRSKSPVRRSKSPTRPVRKGRGRRVKRGGAELEPFGQLGMNDMSSVPAPLHDAPVVDIKNAINATAAMTGGKKRRGAKKSGGDGSNFMENFSKMPTFKDMVMPQDVSTVAGGAKKRKTKGGQDASCPATNEAFTSLTSVGGKSKSKKRTLRGGDSDDLMNMHATEALEPFSLFGGKKSKGRKAKKGGDQVQPSDEELAKQQAQLAMQPYVVPGPMPPQPVPQYVPQQPQQMVEPIPQYVPQPVVQPVPQYVPQPVVQPMPQSGTVGGKRLRKKRGGSYEIPPPLPDMPSPPVVTGGKKNKGKSLKKKGGNANEAKDLMLLPQ